MTDVLRWLTDGDPAIAWQAMRDLADADPATQAATRARVAREGLGAAILAAQTPDGTWVRPDVPAWASTLHTMLVWRATGIDPGDREVARAVNQLAVRFHWHEDLGGRPFFEGEVEPCINGNTLALGVYFGRPCAALAQRLLGDQLPDGGWNCDAPPSTCSSFHSTICVLEGLLAYERVASPAEAATIAAARQRGEAYLLERQLLRRRSTGDVISPAFVQPAFPTTYRYDILRGLEYLHAANLRDPRTVDAIARLAERRQPDGRWLLDAAHTETTAVAPGEVVGAPSRWITLRALRVLR